MKFYIHNEITHAIISFHSNYTQTTYRWSMMTTIDSESVRQELKAFRSQLFKIDLDEESSKPELNEILDKYQLLNDFEPFAEEYVITRNDIEIVRIEKFNYFSPFKLSTFHSFHFS